MLLTACGRSDSGPRDGDDDDADTQKAHRTLTFLDLRRRPGRRRPPAGLHRSRPRALQRHHLSHPHGVQVLHGQRWGHLADPRHQQQTPAARTRTATSGSSPSRTASRTSTRPRIAVRTCLSGVSGPPSRSQPRQRRPQPTRSTRCSTSRSYTRFVRREPEERRRMASTRRSSAPADDETMHVQPVAAQYQTSTTPWLRCQPSPRRSREELLTPAGGVRRRAGTLCAFAYPSPDLLHGGGQEAEHTFVLVRDAN